MEIRIPEEQVKSLVSEAILRSLDENARAAVIQKAIAYLMTPEETRSYGGKSVSPIQTAFNYGIERVAREIIETMITNDETIKMKLRDIVADAWQKAVDSREELVDKVSSAIAQGLSGRGRY